MMWCRCRCSGSRSACHGCIAAWNCGLGHGRWRTADPPRGFAFQREVPPMARVFITGSADGLGLVAARQLAAAGHRVLLHARSDARAEAARRALPQADGVAIGDAAELAG